MTYLHKNLSKITINAINPIKFRGQRAKQGAAVGHAARIGRVCRAGPRPVPARAVGV